MKIALLEDVAGLGSKFDIKEVKDGYARNFLIPKKLAKIADKKSTREIEALKELRLKNQEEQKASLQTFAEKLSKDELIFEIKVGENGSIFGSVSKENIKNRIYKAAGENLQKYLDALEIHLERPIKGLGEHIVDADLGRGVKARIKIRVLAQQ